VSQSRLLRDNLISLTLRLTKLRLQFIDAALPVVTLARHFSFSVHQPRFRLLQFTLQLTANTSVQRQ